LGDKEILFALDRVMGSLRANPSLMTNAAKGDLGGIAMKMQDAISYAQSNPRAVNLYATQFGGTLTAGATLLQLSAYDQARRRSPAGLRDGNDDGKGERTSGSSRRFTGLRSGGGSLGAYAQGIGLSWISADPEITRQLFMGGVSRSDIKLLADMHLTESSYRRLTQDAGFKAKDVVSIAKYAKAKGLDLNKTNNAIADLEKTVPETPEEKKRLRKALMAHIDKPEDETARKELGGTFKYFRKKYPGKAHHIDRAEKALKLEDTDATSARIGRDVEKNISQKAVKDYETQKTTSDAVLASLNAGLPAQQGKKQTKVASADAPKAQGSAAPKAPAPSS
jgi:hypothetical protein